MSTFDKLFLKFATSIFIKLNCLDNINIIKINIIIKPDENINFLFINKKKFKLTRQSQ